MIKYRAWQKPKVERDKKIMELREQGLSFDKIRLELIKLGLGKVTRQRVFKIYHRQKSK